MLAGGLREAIKEVLRRATSVARLQAELVKAELATTGKKAGAGAGAAIGAALVGVFAFALLTALFVVALAIVLPAWLSILIVLLMYVALAAVLGAIAGNLFRRAKGARVAAEQARLTAGALRLRRDGPARPASAPIPTHSNGWSAAAAGPASGPDDGGGGAGPG